MDRKETGMQIFVPFFLGVYNINLGKPFLGGTGGHFFHQLCHGEVSEMYDKSPAKSTTGT